jgi:myo-inositol-1(or 4)-monophosphatase
MQGELEELLSIATHAARMAAAVHRRARQGTLGSSTRGSPIDLVTEVDREADIQPVSTIRTTRPDDAIFGEEGTNVIGNSGICWILDPLDGTTNFVHGYPASAVSVGVEIDGKRVLGVVHHTAHDRVYTGIVGVGTQGNDQRITCVESLTSHGRWSA